MKTIMSIKGPPTAEPLLFTILAIKSLFWPKDMLPEPAGIPPVREGKV